MVSTMQISSRPIWSITSVYFKFTYLGNEIENVLNQASEWLLQVQQTQDLLNRIDLYFNIKTPTVIERLKKEGIDNSKGGWFDMFAKNVKSLSSIALRKGSKMVQANFFTAMAPAAAMVTFAIMGSTSTLPWKTDINLNAFIPAMMVMVVPYMLDSMAEGIEKNKMYGILENWAQCFEKMSANIRKYNQFLLDAIQKCVNGESDDKIDIELTSMFKNNLDLEKYVLLLTKNLNSIEEGNEEKFEEMRQRTEAYFKHYIEVKEGDWTIVLPEEKEKKEGQEK